jgi:ectoine hydroxylase
MRTLEELNMSILKHYWSVIRRLKMVHVLYNVSNYGKLKRNSELYRKFGIRKSVVSPISHAAISKPSAELPWLDGDNPKELLKKHPEFASFSAEIQEQLLQWPDAGYMILPGKFAAAADRINSEVDRIIRDKELDFDYTNSRVMNAWTRSEMINAVMNDGELKKVLGFTLGKKVTPFQTISFLKGSEQETHSDFIHMTTEPKGYLIAAWIALEDIGPEQGPLHYYPGSHKLPYVLGDSFEHSSNAFVVGDDLYGNFEKKIAEEVKTSGIPKKIFHAKKGDVLIWHANLLHGGEEVTDKNSSRKSLVVHYFCEGDVLCYHEITQRPAVINAQ